MTEPCCRFCAVARGNRSNPWDTILLETPHFLVTPTLGSIVDGWLLILSKRHHLCVGALAESERTELKAVIQQVSAGLAPLFGPTAIFEHGPSKSEQAVGCGVDHAHLHMVPTTADLLSGAERFLPETVRWESAVGIESTHQYYKAGLPYLYVEQNGQPMIATGPNLPSQVFRKVLASAAGQPGAWNWREHTHLDSILKTITRLKDRFALHERPGIAVGR